MSDDKVKPNQQKGLSLLCCSVFAVVIVAYAVWVMAAVVSFVLFIQALSNADANTQELALSGASLFLLLR